MRFAVSGGGTAGHVNPAIAVALELRSRGHEVLYIGTPTGPEATLAPKAGLEFWPLEAAGYDRARKSTFFTSSLKIARSALKAKRYFKKNHFDCALGFGGYVSLPVGFGAKLAHVPIVVHEQNSVPGMTNDILSLVKGAQVALTYEMSRKYLKCDADQIHIVGNPVRPSVLHGDRERGRKLLGVPDDALLMLVAGGSLGAKHLNEAICAMRDDLLAYDNLWIVQSTGKANFDEVNALMAGVGPRWQVRSYIDAMGDILAACDFMVSRAGASSLAEICARGVPAILVPFPHATDDHQTKNASDLTEADAALMVPDSDIDSGALLAAIRRLVEDEGLRKDMGTRISAFSRPDATEKLADLVEETATKAAQGTTL